MHSFIPGQQIMITPPPAVLWLSLRSLAELRWFLPTILIPTTWWFSTNSPVSGNCTYPSWPYPDVPNPVCLDVLSNITVLQNQANDAGLYTKSAYENLTDQVNTTKNVLNETLVTGFSTLNENVENVHNSITKQLDEIRSVQEETATIASRTQKDVETLLTDTDIVKKTVIDLQQQLDHVKKESSKIYNELAKVVSKIEAVSSDVDVIKRKVEELQKVRPESKPEACGKKPEKLGDTAFYLLISWTINITIMVIGYNVNKRDDAQGSGHGSAPQLECDYTDQRNGPPTCDLSVVTFSDSSMEEIRSILERLGIKIPPHYMVRNAAEASTKIRRSLRYLVVIGYDGRNSIVEDMDDTQGSKKRDTIEQLQRTGGDVLVIYVDNDTTSGDLADGDLYHRKLERARSHPVLSRLVGNRRFMSIHRARLSAKQEDHMRSWISGT